VNDKTAGKIAQITLLPSSQVGITSGGVLSPIENYFLQRNPEIKIPAANVGQIRNFSPRYENETDWLYGLSQLYPGRKIIQKYNEGTEMETDLLQKKGIRDLVFNTAIPENAEADYESLSQTRDKWDKKINSAGPGSILINNSPLGSIRVGFNPTDLGLLDSQKVTKEDICSLFHVMSILFNWSDQTTFNNLNEATKISLIDAVIPELNAMKHILNTWLLPSYDKNGEYFLDFSLDCFPELQEDTAEKVKWLKDVPLTANEFREAVGWGLDTGENSNKVLVNSNKKILDDLGLESFGSNELPEDPDLIDDQQI
jgi:hypothetical protein